MFCCSGDEAAVLSLWVWEFSALQGRGPALSESAPRSATTMHSTFTPQHVQKSVDLSSAQIKCVLVEFQIIQATERCYYKILQLICTPFHPFYNDGPENQTL